MLRTTGPDEAPSKLRKGDKGRGARSTQPRSVLISKALSRLLRHQAVNEGVPITKDGWVRLDDLLAWKGLTSRNGVSLPPTIDEIWEVVEENEKKRFAVKYAGKEGPVQSELAIHDGDSAAAVEEVVGQPSATVDELMAVDDPADLSTTQGLANTVGVSMSQHQAILAKAKQIDLSAGQTEVDPSAHKVDSETSDAINLYRTTSPAPPASHFFIRATQGHSIKAVADDSSLLTPITLSEPSSIPSVCVHGTFYGSWPAILASGGLKRMRRNHVHFASGPSLSEIGVDEAGDTHGKVAKGDKVISGMRGDAQLLIYIDLKRCLEDVQAHKLDMKWWRSENGVILTEGIAAYSLSGASEDTMDVDVDEEKQPAASPTQAAESSKVAEHMASVKANGGRKGQGKHQHSKSKAVQQQALDDKLVPMKYWSFVVDVKGGHGVIWRQGQGQVKTLPDHLTSRGTPKGRGRGR